MMRRNTVWIAMVLDPVSALADLPQTPPVITNFAANQKIELEAAVAVELNHPSFPRFGGDEPTSDCTFTQGSHTARAQGDTTCTFKVGALVKAGFSVGAATLQVQTT